MAKFKGIGLMMTTYFLVVPLCLFYGLLLASCTSTNPGSLNLYIIQFRASEQVWIRVGYFGICHTKAAGVFCIQSGLASHDVINQRLSESMDGSDLASNITEQAVKLQKEAIINVLAIATMLFFLGLVVDLLRFYSAKRTRKLQPTESSFRRRKMYRQSSLALFWSTCAFTSCAALANTQMVRAIEQRSGDLISAGAASLGLHWTVSAISFLFALGVSLVHRSGDSNSGGEAKSAGNPFAARPAAKGIINL